MNIALLRNQFDNATKGNHKRMISASTDHFDKLAMVASSDAVVNGFYQTALPAFQKYIAKYAEVQTNYNLYQGQTQLFEEEILLLRSTLIRKWDVIIQNEYDETSAQYKMLLPNGRAPFQNNPYDLRLSSVASLLASVSAMNNPNLATLATNIDNWLQATKQLRTTQQGTEALDSILRQELEQARKNLATAMHLVFFQLCVHYHSSLSKVETFYEWNYFKAPASGNGVNTTVKTVDVPVAERVTVDTRDYDNNVAIEIENIGDAAANTWISSTENSSVPANVSFLNPQESGNYVLSDLSDGSTPEKFLIVQNRDNNLPAKLKVTILEE